jgi:multidrug efflux pump subunit AcrB
MGYNLSIISILGIVALSGIVVNDSLILVDFINRSRDKGIPIIVAIIESGVPRFRPIILTTLTTYFGLLPMLFEQSLQARFLIPMAISLAFGVMFSTFVILI